MSERPMNIEEIRQQGSIKTLVVSICTGVASVGVVIIMGYIVVVLIRSLDTDTIKLAATVFLFGLVALILSGISLVCVAFFNNIRKPGLQSKGALAQLEKILGMD